MHDNDTASNALAALEMRAGLGPDEVHEHLRRALRIGEAGHRVVAFYLTEMAAHDLYVHTGHRDSIHFAEDALGLDRRRASELLTVGRRLSELPLVDAAFCNQKLTWSQVLLLVKAAEPATEEAWVASAQNKTVRELTHQVTISKPGGPPVEAKDGKGTPCVRRHVGARVLPPVFRKFELARQRLQDERGGAVTDAEVIDSALEVLLQFEKEGAVKGQKRVRGSLYRILLRPDTDGHLCMDGEFGPERLDEDDIEQACACCDAATAIEDENGRTGERPLKDQKTSTRLREKILQRDAYRCRCCGARLGMHVHHIQWRENGGPTRPWNLLVLCKQCHAKVHEGLLVLLGRRAKEVRFADERGRPLKRTGPWVEPGELLALRVRHQPALEPDAPVGPGQTGPALFGLDDVPAVIDGAWWRRHAGLIHWTSGRGLSLTPGVPAPEEAQASSAPEPSPEPSPEASPEAFANLRGQEKLFERLRTTARGRRARGRCYPHTLFVGPPGTGKTTLARAVASSYGSRLHSVSGPLLDDKRQLVSLLAGLSDGDMLFLDEIHAVPPRILETLYQAMAERRVDLMLHEGTRSRTITLRLPAFTVLGATTDEGRLPGALHSRFGRVEALDFYADEDLAAVVAAKAKIEGYSVSAAGSLRVASVSRGTPREALRLVELLLDRAAVGGLRQLDRSAVDAALRSEGIDTQGLDETDRRYLGVLRGSRRPVSLARIARILGLARSTIQDRIEPYLMRRRFIDVTSGGRVALPAVGV